MTPGLGTLDRVCMRLATLVPLFLVACSSTPRPEPGPSKPSCDATLPAPATVPAISFLGETQNDHYVPLEPDLVLFRHYGAQGGQHFWIGVQVYSPDARIWSFDAKLVGGGGEILASGSQGLTACANAWTQQRQVTVFLEPPYTALGGTLQIEASSPPDQFSFEGPVSVP